MKDTHKERDKITSFIEFWLPEKNFFSPYPKTTPRHSAVYPFILFMQNPKTAIHSGVLPAIRHFCNPKTGSVFQCIETATQLVKTAVQFLCREKSYFLPRAKIVKNQIASINLSELNRKINQKIN